MVERPTWTAVEVPDMTSSMTAVIAVQKLAGVTVPDSVVTDNDLLAAFSGETCLGIAQLQDGLFFLYITAPPSVSAAVSLRYWSAHYTNLFIAADAFPFVNDTQQGTVAAPFVPAFELTK